MKQLLALSLVLSMLACQEIPAPVDPVPPTPLTPYEFLLNGPIDSLRLANKIPGLAVGIVEGEDLTYEGYFGLTQLAGTQSVNQETRFTAGPFSNMVTTVAVLQLVQEGKLDLDVPVSTYLDWDFVHPIFPQATISLRMLLSHTSSIRDDSALLATLISAGDPAPDLRPFLRAYLESNGELYAQSHFDLDRPGKRRFLSAVGMAMAAHVVEQVEGVPFSIWCESDLFAKLGFSAGGWFLANVPNPDNIALPHRNIGGSVVSQTLYGYPPYPAGLLRVNLRSASRLWRALVLGGAFGDQRFFGAEENKMLTSVQFPFADSAQALGWTRRQLVGQDGWKVGGDDLGYSSLSFYDPATGRGVMLFANIAGAEPALQAMAELMILATP